MSEEAKQAAIVRTAEEFQQAHDMLRFILLNEPVRQAFCGDRDSKDEYGVRAAMDVLCWALGHAHNTTFARNLQGIARELEECGVVMIDLGRLTPGGRP